MAHQPRNYETLRDDHQNALNALNSHIEQGQQPTRDGPSQVQSVERDAAQEVTAHSAPERPEGHYGDRLGWTDRGDMASQQKSAVDMIKAHNDDRQINDHTAAKEALDKHIDSPGIEPPGVDSPEQSRTPDDLER